LKPTVHYKDIGFKPEVGACAFVWPLDHQSPRVSNTREVMTSTVVRVGINGEFETKNTIYKRVPEQQRG
jgi:hypothetical protein